MSSIDLYDILDVEPECSQQDIIKAYRKLVKKYHPDKPEGDADLFELINLAFDKLSDSKKRKEYDSLKKISDESSKKHHSRREEFDEFNKLQEATKTEQSTKDAKISYDSHFSTMDAKHKYIRTDDNTKEINEDDAIQMHEDLRLLRDDDDIENIQERLFVDGKFSLQQFNDAFEQAHGTSNDLIPHEGNPNAYATENTQYSSYSGNYEDVYMDDDADNTFVLDGNSTSSINFGKQHRSFTSDQVKQMKKSSDVYGHKGIDPEYTKNLEQIMQNHIDDRKNLTTMDMSNYETDPDMDGYGILNQIEYNVTSCIDWDDADDVKNKYNKLLQLRSGEDTESK